MIVNDFFGECRRELLLFFMSFMVQRILDLRVIDCGIQIDHLMDWYTLFVTKGDMDRMNTSNFIVIFILENRDLLNGVE